MDVIYSARSVNVALEKELGARRVSLDELLADSDFVSLHVALTDETRHTIGAAELAKMKPTAVLINTARGAIVDEAALAQALEKRTIAAAALDVFEREPKLTPGLADLPNVVLAPHTGSATLQARHQMGLMAAQNLVAALGGAAPLNLVNQPKA